MNEAQQARHIDGQHTLRAAKSDVETGSVGRNGHAERLRSVAIQFVKRNLYRFAHIRSEKRKRVRERTTVLQVRQRHQILRVKLGHDAEAAVGGNGQVEDARDRVQRDAINNLRASCVDHRDLRLRRRAVFQACSQRRKIWIDVCRVNPRAVGRERQITRAAPGQQTLFLCARPRIQNSNVAGDAVGNKDVLARRVLDDAGGL